MAGVWVFKNGVYTLVDRSKGRANDGTYLAGSLQKKEMLHLPSGQVITSYDMLEPILLDLGWERYAECTDPRYFQFHKPESVDLITLYKDFAKFTSIQMYDIVVKVPDIFYVRDA